MKKFDNYCRNLEILWKADNEDLQNEFIISGIIDKFYIQFELGWKVLKELLEYEGRAEASSGSPRQILKASYATFDFIEEDIWLAMLQDRNDLTHIYNGDRARELVNDILEKYIPVFTMLKNQVDEKIKKEPDL